MESLLRSKFSTACSETSATGTMVKERFDARYVDAASMTTKVLCGGATYAMVQLLHCTAGETLVRLKASYT